MNIRVFTSKQARERAKRDAYIKANKKRYRQEIFMIVASGGMRPSETIGKFTISPRGHKNERVAWHWAYDSKTDTKLIFVDDFLYHLKDNKYVDNWAIRADAGEINLNSYFDYVEGAEF